MNKDNIIFDILYLCQKRNLTDEEINMLVSVFENKIIDVNYNNSCFISSASFFGNYYMIKILKKYGANITTDDNKPYKLALQNSNLDCLELLI